MGVVGGSAAITQHECQGMGDDAGDNAMDDRDKQS